MKGKKPASTNTQCVHWEALKGAAMERPLGPQKRECYIVEVKASGGPTTLLTQKSTTTLMKEKIQN